MLIKLRWQAGLIVDMLQKALSCRHEKVKKKKQHFLVKRSLYLEAMWIYNF